MGNLNFAFLPLVLLICCSYGCEVDYDGKLSIRLEHSLDQTQSPEYFHRADIAIKSLHSGASSIEENELTKEEIRLLKNLAKQNGNYRVRATAKGTDGKEYLFYTFVKACSLIESHLQNVITVNLDHDGNVIAVTMAVPKICTTSEVKSSSLTTFNTSVEVRHMELGPIPDTASYIQKLEREREAKERGDAKDNRSFIAKYWMYIVPVAIVMLLPSATNPESGGAPAQR